MNDISKLKICVEISCGHIFEPDHTGKCPRCGSESLWLISTSIGQVMSDRKEVADGKV